MKILVWISICVLVNLSLSLDIRWYPSPNYSARPQGVEIDTLILHHTECKNVEEALEILTSKEEGVSAHYVIAKNGTIY